MSEMNPEAIIQNAADTRAREKLPERYQSTSYEEMPRAIQSRYDRLMSSFGATDRNTDG